jgi:hypothetical protein
MSINLCFGKLSENLINYNINDIINDYKPDMNLINYYSKINKLKLYLINSVEKKFDSIYIDTKELNEPTNINLEKYDYFVLKYFDGA